MNGPATGARPRRRVLLGIARVARLRADGIAEFGDDVPAFLASLAPWLALPLVQAVLQLLQGDGIVGLTDLGFVLVVLLAPPVLSQALAARSGHDTAWLRYAVAFNWCQWLVMPAFVAAMVGSAVLARLGIEVHEAFSAGMLGLVGYALALHWLLVRRALGFGRWSALAVVLAVNLGTAVLGFGPRLLAGKDLSGWIDPSP